MARSVYGPESWGAYYSDTLDVRTIEVDQLDQQNTLALYLYGALGRPDEADLIRDVDSKTIVAKVSSASFVAEYQDILTGIIGSRITGINEFFRGDYDDQILEYYAHKTAENGSGIIRHSPNGMLADVTIT